MKFLLDTHLLLWSALESAKLPAKAGAFIHDPEVDLVFSVISIWEVVVKNSLGRSSFQVNPHRLRSSLLENGYTELPVSGEHALAVASLPNLHKDPFDRMLIGQAIVEGMTLLTSDEIVASYPGPIVGCFS